MLNWHGSYHLEHDHVTVRDNQKYIISYVIVAFDPLRTDKENNKHSQWQNNASWKEP